MRRTGLIGVGNVLMCDDGIGMILIDRFCQEQKVEEMKGLEVISLGTGGMTLVHKLSELDSALIVDSGDFGGNIGDYRIFSPEDAESIKFLPGQSLHEFDLMHGIQLSKAMGECPHPLRIMAIQPGNISWGEKISFDLEERLEEYSMALLAELQNIIKNNHSGDS